MKEDNKKKIWKITANSDTGLKPVYIDAFSFDEALEIARKIDNRYNSGSVHSYKYSYCY